MGKIKLFRSQYRENWYIVWVESLNFFFILYSKVYFIWIKDLNVKKESYEINRRKYYRIFQ